MSRRRTCDGVLMRTMMMLIMMMMMKMMMVRLVVHELKMMMRG